MVLTRKETAVLREGAGAEAAAGARARALPHPAAPALLHPAASPGPDLPLLLEEPPLLAARGPLRPTLAMVARGLHLPQAMGPQHDREALLKDVLDLHLHGHPTISVP